MSSTTQSLAGWKLRDRAGNEFPLGDFGTLPVGRTDFVMLEFSMPLNNAGDDITLLDDGGNVRHHVTYTAAEVLPGVTINFEEPN